MRSKNFNPTTDGFSATQETFRKISQNMNKVMRGQSDAIRKLLAAFAGGGHILLEDYPGTGKTTLAKALTRSIDADFKPIQFTPDLLPSDILSMSSGVAEKTGLPHQRTAKAGAWT